MKKILTWLKAKAREWCAPDYEDVARKAERGVKDSTNYLNSWSQTADLLVEERAKSAKAEATVELLRAQFNQPFEPRESDSPPAWDDEDRNNWRVFQTTPTGRRLQEGLNWWAQYKEQQATITTKDQVYACGVAAGYRAFGTWAIHTLSADNRPEQVEDTQQQQGAAALRERHAP